MSRHFLRGAFILGMVVTCLFGGMDPRLGFADGTTLRQHSRAADKLSWGRNPFTLMGGSERSASGLSLTGILWDPKTPQAIINDTVVGVGDRISDQTVTEIDSDKVVLNDGTQNYELRME